jgi:hypothetical protein
MSEVLCPFDFLTWPSYPQLICAQAEWGKGGMRKRKKRRGEREGEREREELSLAVQQIPAQGI